MYPHPAKIPPTPLEFRARRTNYSRQYVSCGVQVGKFIFSSGLAPLGVVLTWSGDLTRPMNLFGDVVLGAWNQGIAVGEVQGYRGQPEEDAPQHLLFVQVG